MITWIIGQGGLLGSALARHCQERYEPGAIPWQDPQKATLALHAQARAFEQFAGSRPWRILWAAGAATTSTTADRARTELQPLEGLVNGLRSAIPRAPGSFFLTSSAGGVYAGSSGPPFTVDTPPIPLSPYGELKLAQERLVAEALAGMIPVTVGRISNLYGPGQNLDKLQGLISRLAMASITRQPINIFVPLGTIRDYVFADDAARAIIGVTADSEGQRGATTQIIATGRGTTIGQLVRTMGEVTKRRVPVALGSHPSSVAQAEDLRVTPSVQLPHVTPLPEGMKSVLADLLARLQETPLAR